MKIMVAYIVFASESYKHMKDQHKLPLWWSCSHASLVMCTGPSGTKELLLSSIFATAMRKVAYVLAPLDSMVHIPHPLAIYTESHSCINGTSSTCAHTLFSGKLMLRQSENLQSSIAHGGVAFSPQ